MSTSDPERTIPFEAYAQDEAAELFVVDDQFRLVERGRGRLRTKLAPGIYQVKLRAGPTFQEKYIHLRAGDRPRPVPFERTEFASPVPLDRTSKTHEYHVYAAVGASRTPPLDVGQGRGSSIFVFARDWSGRVEARQRSPSLAHPARGLALRDVEGAAVVDLAERSESNLAEARRGSDIDPWAACHVEVAPGPYLLALDTPAGRLEQTVVASEGWQTQIFLTQRDYVPGRDELYADLPGASILLARAGRGFDSSESQKRLVELTRLGLANRRHLLPDELIEQILLGKIENPMLGLFGAHILLRRKKADAKSLRTIVRNLRGLLGKNAHPDVEALALRVDRRRVSYEFRVPPMLRRSWALVVPATAKRPELIPSGSLAARAAPCIWGEEPWLLWMWPAEPTGSLEGYRKALRAQIRPPAAEPTAPETPPAAPPRRRAKGMSKAAAAARATAKDPTPISDAAMAQLVRTCGLPRTVVEDLITTLD